MSRKGVDIKKGRIGANVTGQPFRTSALLTTGVAVAGKLVLGTMYTLTNSRDAVALGLIPEYDVANNVVLAEHVAEFFRMAGDGTKLYLMVAPQATMLDELIEEPEFAKKMITEAQGDIYRMGIGFNPAAGYTETAVDGINTDVRACILKAQALHQWSYDTFRPVNIYLEGRAYAGPAATTVSLRALPALPSGIQECPKVSIVTGQDWNYADALTGHAQKYAAIGTMLGCRASQQINQNIGEVETMNLTDEQRGKWTVAGLSNHKKITEVEDELDTLDTKGFIFPMTYTGVSGYRFNDDHTCVPVIVDALGNMNEHTIAYGETLDLCVRMLRTALLPQVKKTKSVVSSTGKLPIGIVKEFEGYGNDVFADMAARGWISGGKCFVDPDSDILVAKLLNVSFEVVPYGVIGNINGTINLKIRS